MKSQRKVEPGCRRQCLASGTVIAAGALLETLGLTACSPLPTQKPVIGLVLGAGAARGFAHIGVIKSLEAQGIRPDLVIGSSAGSVVAALLASGLTGNEMNRLAMNLDEATIADWGLPFMGRFGGVFQPAVISGHEYVDGGLVAPVPVSYARQMGATIVIAVNISSEPIHQDASGTFGILQQTISIMQQSINQYELKSADIVIQPQLLKMSSGDFKARNAAILSGELATQQKLGQIKELLKLNAQVR